MGTLGKKIIHSTIVVIQIQQANLAQAFCKERNREEYTGI